MDLGSLVVSHSCSRACRRGGRAGDQGNSTNQQPWKVQELDSLNKLLIEFNDLFEEPESLPPHRHYDHSIILKPNTEPINIQAYGYPPKQKVEIENLIKDMLARSLIRPSQSPYAPPILLVKKRMVVGCSVLTSISLTPKP